MIKGELLTGLLDSGGRYRGSSFVSSTFWENVVAEEKLRTGRDGALYLLLGRGRGRGQSSLCPQDKR